MQSWPPGYAPPNGQLGGEIVNALKFELDQPVGVGRLCNFEAARVSHISCRGAFSSTPYRPSSIVPIS